jgi:hypothetical protein
LLILYKSDTSNSSQDEITHKEFLNEFSDGFVNSISRELPPSRGEEDHRIDLIAGTTPPKNASYKVSLPQQEGIMAQLKELVEKGMVQPSSSHFYSLV